MNLDTSQPRAETSVQNTITPSEIFATVQQLSSQLDGSRTQHIVEGVASLAIDDIQSIVNLLSMALEKHHHLLVHAYRVLNLLTEIASSTKTVARNRTLDFDQLTLGTSPGVYTASGESPTCVQVIKEDAPGVSSKALINWAHLSHPNILPVYGVFLDGTDSPISFVSPVLVGRNIVDHAKSLLQAERMPLICDVIDGLCYLHQLNVAHGSLNPESVLISDKGQVYLTDLHSSPQTTAISYWAPEVLENEDTLATKSADVWALGCLCYEVFSGNVPYCQYRQDKVVAAVLARKKPTRPGQQGVKGEEIDDVTWDPVSACWEFDPGDRPGCSKLRDAFVSLSVHGNRPIPQPSLALGSVEAPVIDLENTRSLLHRVVGSDQLLQPPSQIPDQLRDPLSGLAYDLPKAYSVAAAAKKLNPSDTQILLDALDLLVEENPSFAIAFNPVMELMETLMASTHIYPQRYELRRLRYDPSPIAEDSFGKVYKDHDLEVCVNMLTDPSDAANIIKYLALWAHSSHPNVLPFYGVFKEVVNDIPRLCVVSPFMKNGTLLEYAPRLPQKSRISLISDVLDGLAYLNTRVYAGRLRPDNVMISDDGRAFVTSFYATSIMSCTAAAKATRSSALRIVRFHPPEYLNAQEISPETVVWSFGCLCYEVLSGKPPYHQYKETAKVESALARGEPPKRPSTTDNDIEMIDDTLWKLIIGCCKPQPEDRLTVIEIQKLLINLGTRDERPDGQKLPGAAILNLRKRPDIDWDRVEQLLGQIQVELLRSPLSRLIQNRIEDIAVEVVNLDPSDVQTLVDFLDVTLKDHLTISEERNRALALLSRVMTSSQVFPRRHQVKGIKYDPRPIAEGGFGKVHRGTSNPTMCVKVTTRVNDPRALVAYIRELILWAHLSHPNVLPFYGTFFDDSQRLCLVSPYMMKGNLGDYAHQLPQSSRIPLLLDTIKGLDYLHGLGIVHTDLKGENVLISDEGRGLITDFGASHIVTATAKLAVATAPMVTTLRFTAPEIIQNGGRRVPSWESDIWSFGCLCYQVLSRKLPYYEFKLDTQVFAALVRGQLPNRPGLTKSNTNDFSHDDGGDINKKDWDNLDDTIWSLIIKCLILKPEKRPNTSQIRELIIDMKAWDHRPAMKDVPDTRMLKQGPDVMLNLNCAGTLLDHLQILFLVRSIYKYSNQDIATALAKLSVKDWDALDNFWATVLDKHLRTFVDQSCILAIHSAAIASRAYIPIGYAFGTWPQYHLETCGKGSFGKVYRESKLNICVKVALGKQMNPDLQQQWFKALAPWAHSSHPNILPFYGVDLLRGELFLVSPFIENGNMHKYALRLPPNSRMLLILDVIEGLMYLHNIGIIHGNLKTQNILISHEGRALITDFRPYHVNVAAAVGGPTGSFITSTLRFTAPELVQNRRMLPTAASDVWSVGCLFYEVLSRRVPYYKYSEDPEIRAALFRDELPTRPVSSDGITDEIDDRSWDLIKHCCASKPGSRPKLRDIQEWLGNMNLEDVRPAARTLPGAEVLKERQSYEDIDVVRLAEVLDKLKTHHQNAARVEVTPVEAIHTEPTCADATRAEPTRAEPTHAEVTCAEATHAEPTCAEVPHAEEKPKMPMNTRIGSFLSKIPQAVTFSAFRRQK